VISPCGVVSNMAVGRVEDSNKDSRIRPLSSSRTSTCSASLQLKRGAAQVAVRARSDVRIVQICCTPPYLNKQEKWYRVPRQKPFFLVRVMEKVSINEFLEDAPSDAAAARKLTEYLTRALVPKTV